MSTSTHYGAIVIGSGQSATPLATSLASAGHKTALIELTHIGGTCINEGCTPTKTMIASGRTVYVAVHAKNMGVEFKRSSLQLNWLRVRERKREIVESFRGGSEKRLEAVSGLEVIRGRARFKTGSEVEVTLNEGGGGEVRTLTADKVFINAGCSPAPLTIKDVHVVEPANLLTSTSIMELDEVPRHLLVIGGGYIGCEFAQLFRRFGSQVSIVQRAQHLLPNEDVDVSVEMEKILTDDGIKLYLGAKPEWFSKVPTGSVVLQVTTRDGGTKSIFTSHVLNATGRVPNTKELNLDAAGIKVDAKGFIVVNEFLETSAPDVYAMGDIKGGPAFTHISYDDFRVLNHNLVTKMNEKPLSIEGRLVPYCVFTDPQLGRIGLTERQATEKYKHSAAAAQAFAGLSLLDADRTPTLEHPSSTPPNPRIAVAKMPMSYVARALEMNESRGLMKAVVDLETQEILGFACLGYEGGEVMAVVQMAMKGGLSWRDLRDGVFAHPTMSEGLNNLFSQISE